MINFAGIYNNRYNMKYGFVRVAAAIPIVKVHNRLKLKLP